ncbi:MAG: hypothetical protein U0168_02415 [Nannocystaceae bacterium]|jgi:hypothetical protein
MSGSTPAIATSIEATHPPAPDVAPPVIARVPATSIAIASASSSSGANARTDQ